MPLPPQLRPAKSKLKNVACAYNGHVYRSTKEARYAQRLDAMFHSGEIMGWQRGTAIYLVVNGRQLIGPKGRRLFYLPDFRVEHHNERIEYVEVKGRRDGVPFRLSWLKLEIVRAMGKEVTLI